MNIAIMLLLTSLGAAAPVRPSGTREAELGRRVFRARCIGCHGEDARGSAAFAKGVGAYDPSALDLTSERLLALDDAALAQRIQSGHGRMKGFGLKLSAQEIRNLVAYLRLLGHARAGATPASARGR